ncbi:MAG TPA: peptidoglycan-binding domain-containing protein [Candidatus Dormibacteraeota bacterium]|nr:peptidoglycan-binding domain-containing protein [Candidatus Dormibacteraeota bacterium]
MASTRARNRHIPKLLSAAIAVASLCHQATALAAPSPGGTAPVAGAPPAASAPAALPTTGHAPGVVSFPSAHVTSIRITAASCVPSAACSSNPHQVSVHGLLALAGKGLHAGLIVGFPRARGARVSSSSPASRLRVSGQNLVVTVPSGAHSGNIMVLLGGGRHTSSFGPIYVFNHKLHPPAPPVTGPITGGVSGTGFEGQGMWIWYLSKSNGGELASLAEQAHRSGVTTVFVKSSDGSSNYWSQFSPSLVVELHARGIKVCAWQYVYGASPAGEAALGARAVASGADCLVIDAEAEYEGKYGAAQTYINDLRAQIGPAYPLGLASFPYVSYHPSLPYSVFLGPNGAQFNAPQMYWKAIGASVDTVYANTYIGNRIYGRPLFPLGQSYESPSAAELVRFREEAVDYGATGWSFWDWQETSASGWSALAAPLAPLTSVTPNTSYPELGKGAKGDQVLWLQEHLASAYPEQQTTGNFGAQTVTNLSAFQSAHGIPPSGRADAATWQALLALPPVAVNWTGGGPSG